MDKRTLKDLLYEQVARVGKALASPKRLEILEIGRASCRERVFGRV